jgi:hypothetical protein
VSTSTIIGCKLSKDDESKEVDQRIYISMIGNLLYVTTSRPDVMQEIGHFTIFQVTPKETHVLEVKTIFKYLKGTIDFGPWYLKENYLTMVAYTDAYWEGTIDDRGNKKMN